MPTIQLCFKNPLWEQFREILPQRVDSHPLGCHKQRVEDYIVFDKLLDVLVFVCAYWRIADETCSATTLRRRRDEWIAAGVMDKLESIVRDSYDLMIGLDLENIPIDGCITKAPCGGECAGPSPVDRKKLGVKRSLAVDGNGIPLGIVLAQANNHDSPLLGSTLDTLDYLAPFPLEATSHLDKGYDSIKTRAALEERHLLGDIARKGLPSPLHASTRWVVERTNSWHYAFKKLVWCTERKRKVIAFYLSFANVIIILRRLMREGWRRYRWDSRPTRCW